MGVDFIFRGGDGVWEGGHLYGSVNLLKKMFLAQQCSTFITLCLGSIGMGRFINVCVKKGQFYKGIIGK